MANEWQSLLQSAPNLNVDLLGSFNKNYNTAQEQKKTAYDMYRTQKAQEIASKATRPDGTMDWDAMFQAGKEAGIGLDAFNQVNKMQSERRASEVANAQNRMVLESMGYDPTLWDPSQGNIADQTYRQQYGRNSQPVPFTPPTEEQARAYDFLTAPSAETQIPQGATATFGTQGVGETAQTQGVPSASAQVAPQDVVPAPNEVIITPNAIPSSGTFTLPEPPMAERPIAQTEGYYNELWRAHRDPEAMKRMLQGSAVGTTGPQLSVAQMSDAEKANLSRYLAMRGIANADPQQALTALENMAIQSVPQPVLNPMVGMMSKDDQAKEYGRYRQAVAEYPAKVQEAITKVSDSIKSGNMDVVTQDLAKTASRIAQAGNERAQQEYARGRQAANQLVAMGVTAKPMPDADVKALQDVFIPAIADIKQAGNGFGGAMQAAIAKSKVDGSLNFDAILANLTAMGAMPSDQAAKIKAKLTPEAYTAFGAMAKAGSVDAIKEGLRGLGFDVGVGTGATNALWETSALGNVFQQAQAHGMTKSYFDKQSKVTPWSQESPTEVLSRQPQATPARQTSPRQTQSSGYSETKINAAGMEMGRRKSDGKWEPVR